MSYLRPSAIDVIVFRNSSALSFPFRSLLVTGFSLVIWKPMLSAAVTAVSKFKFHRPGGTETPGFSTLAAHPLFGMVAPFFENKPKNKSSATRNNEPSEHYF